MKKTIVVVCCVVALSIFCQSSARGPKSAKDKTVINQPTPKRTRLGQFKEVELGKSSESRPIQGYIWNESDSRPILIFAAIHGDERTAGELGRRLLERWKANHTVLSDKYLILIPIMNPDGWSRATRKNANGVDCNRNFPAEWKANNPKDPEYSGPKPLSENESKLLANLIETKRPILIITIHSCSYCGGENNFDGPADRVALAMSSCNGYKVSNEWHNDTPGSFGSFAGKLMGIPVVTLELPRKINDDREWEKNISAIEQAIATVENKK